LRKAIVRGLCLGLLRADVLGAAVRSFLFRTKNDILFFQFFSFSRVKTTKRDSWEDLAGNVREVWGSTRGTPKPCRWFLEFVEWQALRCYRMVVLG